MAQPLNEAGRLRIGAHGDATTRKPERGALAAGGLAALLAGACCLGPLALVSIGVSGAWLADFQLLEPYRPVFLGIAAAALAFAWKRSYRIGFWMVAAALALASSAAFADAKTVTLSVPGMYCETCPITVKKALSRVPGVSKVSASYARKEAVVTYDDSKATVDALTRATATAGYPSTVRQ